MDKLGNILSKVVRRQPGGQRILGAQIEAAFRVVIGSEGAGLCETVELRAGTLWVTTTSPALAHQLRLDEATVIERLNALDLGKRVRELRVRTGRPGPAQ